MKPLLSSEYPEKQTLYNLTKEIQLWCTARPTNANSSALCSLNVCPPMSSKTQIHFTQNDQAIWLCHTTATQNHFPKIIIIKQLSGRCLMAPLIVADITQLTFVRNASNAYPLYFLSCFPFEYYLFLSEQSAEPPGTALQMQEKPSQKQRDSTYGSDVPCVTTAGCEHRRSLVN